MYNSSSGTDPARAADWRWSIIRRVVESPGSVFGALSDQFLQTGVRFWKAWTACRNDLERRHVAERLPTAAGAYWIFADGSPSLRIGIEARILANEAPNRIAGHFGTTVAVVRAYEMLFYDVRDRLDCRSFILRDVIGLGELAGEYQPVQVWKAMAYLGGPLLLDELLFPVGGASGHAASAAEVATHLDEIARAQLRRSIASASATTPPGDRRGLEQLARALASLQRDSSEPGADEPLSGYAANIMAMLESMPLHVGRSAQSGSSPLAEIDESAVEPGTSDLIRLLSGEDPNGAWRHATDVPYPVPQRNEPE